MKKLPDWAKPSPHTELTAYGEVLLRAELAESGMKRRGRIILFLAIAWTVTSVIGFLREGQREHAYRLLEQDYMRQTNKLPPKVKP